MISFHVLVIGGGHAGVEAAFAASTLGCTTALVTPDPLKIALMSCNPSIGGIAKGTLVREIDGLDGITGLTADETALQFRMLNMKKGPAVWGPRVQSDIARFTGGQREKLKKAGVEIISGVVAGLRGATERPDSVLLQDGRIVFADSIVICAGTFLAGMLHRGRRSWPGGRRGDISSHSLEKDLRDRMFHVKRFKTGTSPRVLRSSIDTTALELQKPHESEFSFSWRSERPVESTESCWLTRTTGKTETIVKDSLRHSPLYAGRITGKGPRYCPSFEDKVTKFPDRTGHPIHLEPTGANSRIMYMNGFSTSLPEEIQEKIVRSVPGFSNAIVAAFGYSVEYTCFETDEYNRALRLVKTGNVFVAGQVLGTSGYEEAAATGLLAGANAARNSKGLEEIEPDRISSYLGVMVDDLVSTGTEEPYRLFSSRSENRLYLRQDNADRRVFELGCRLGTISEQSRDNFLQREGEYRALMQRMERTSHMGTAVSELCKRPDVTAEMLAKLFGLSDRWERQMLATAVLDLKYQGYILRAERKHRSRDRYRNVLLVHIEDYFEVDSLSIEAAQALNRLKPQMVKDAEKIPGVRQSDMDSLVLHLMKGDVSRGT